MSCGSCQKQLIRLVSFANIANNEQKRVTKGSLKNTTGQNSQGNKEEKLIRAFTHISRIRRLCIKISWLTILTAQFLSLEKQPDS